MNVCYKDPQYTSHMYGGDDAMGSNQCIVIAVVPLGIGNLPLRRLVVTNAVATSRKHCTAKGNACHGVCVEVVQNCYDISTLDMRTFLSQKLGTHRRKLKVALAI